MGKNEKKRKEKKTVSIKKEMGENRRKGSKRTSIRSQNRKNRSKKMKTNEKSKNKIE